MKGVKKKFSVTITIMLEYDIARKIDKERGDLMNRSEYIRRVLDKHFEKKEQGGKDE